MLVSRSQRQKGVSRLQYPALDAVSSQRLRETVEALAYPRHYVANRQNNERARDWLAEQLRELGYKVELQGKYDNVLAVPADSSGEPAVLLGAHYDTVPTTPGADDNNSAIAVCLEVARVLAAEPALPILIAIFNREEDGLLGSFDFVEHIQQTGQFEVSEAHIFEMVGYYSQEPNSQSKPANLPVPIPSTGDFIGVLSNGKSNGIATQLKRAAEQVGSETSLLSLKTFLGIERIFKDLLRSDHTPFWEAGIPALMWTDTSNFRNPNYHRPSDMPDTLDYNSLADVARIIIGYLLMKGMR